jgi:uncharacterized YccA/Bax inhibitor family protein
MATANPALSESIFLNESRAPARAGTMTVNGAIVKTGILSVLLVAAGGVAWHFVHPVTGAEYSYDPSYRLAFGIGAPILGLITALVTCFFPKISPVTAPLYAIFEGLFLGSVSAFAGAKYDGIVTQATLATVSVLFGMLLLYSTRIIRVTERFRTCVLAATAGICILLLANFLLSLFGVNLGLRGNGMLGIGVSAVVIIIASLNLALDFDAFEMGAKYQAPKYMEWYCAFGLMTTLVWLYLEILRLLMKLQSNRE